MSGFYKFIIYVIFVFPMSALAYYWTYELFFQENFEAMKNDTKKLISDMKKAIKAKKNKKYDEDELRKNIVEGLELINP